MSNTNTNATETTTPANKGGANNGYPYRTKREIKALLEADTPEGADFRIECLQVMTARHAVDLPKHGWMSSHEVKGLAITAKVEAGEDVSDDEDAWIRASVPRYSKQLASHFRQAARDADPELATKAAVFGV